MCAHDCVCVEILNVHVCEFLKGKREGVIHLQGVTKEIQGFSTRVSFFRDTHNVSAGTHPPEKL